MIDPSPVGRLFALIPALVVVVSSCSADGGGTSVAAQGTDAGHVGPEASDDARTEGGHDATASRGGDVNSSPLDDGAEAHADAPASAGDATSPDTPKDLPSALVDTGADRAADLTPAPDILDARNPSTVVPDGATVDTGVPPSPPLRQSGSACQRGDQCSTGFCVDEVCCVARRCGVCASCALPSTAGVCAPLRNVGDADSCTMCDGAGACQSRTIRVSPRGLDFAPTVVGRRAEGMRIVVQNATGRDRLLETGKRDDDEGNFVIVSDGCGGKTVPDGGTCEIYVAFVARTAGPKLAYLVVGSFGLDNTLVVLTGTGVRP